MVATAKRSGGDSTRAGTYVRQPGGYRAFIPKPLPPEDLRIDRELQALVSRADVAVGRLDGAARVIPDPDLFVLQYVRREAVLSSQIEGTNASLMDVLEYEAQMEHAETLIDVAEIINYIAAMNHGLRRLPTLPLSRRLLCEVHSILMRDVRGGEPHRTPGEFRRSQNWIGGGSPATARFVPPPPDLVAEAFGNLETFLHDPEPMPPLIKAGIAHAQFETIHPFLDGNGRIGRLLITFGLVEQGILERPLLYASLYFKEHRDEYADRLQGVRDHGAWEEWLGFFLDGVAQVATEATETATRILELRERDRARIGGMLGRRSASALALLDELFKRPVVTAKAVEHALNVSQPTASALVAGLADAGILEEITGKQRNRVFAYRQYLDLFPGAASRQ
jgi:Fic family protein